MGGLGHDFKTGVNFLYEPHLFATFNSGVDDYFYIHLTDERNGPIQTITRNGGTATSTSRSSNTPHTSRTTGASPTG